MSHNVLRQKAPTSPLTAAGSRTGTSKRRTIYTSANELTLAALGADNPNFRTVTPIPGRHNPLYKIGETSSGRSATGDEWIADLLNATGA